MGEKHLIGLVMLLFVGIGGTVLASSSRRIRDLFFFLIVILSPLVVRMQINFFSREWYRGTTRGLEFCAVDALSFSLLAGMLLSRKDGERKIFWPPSLGYMLAFFLFACLCVALADPKIFGLFALSKMVRGMMLFTAVALYVRGDHELRLLAWSLASIVGYEALLAIWQRYGIGTHRVFATLDDSNSLSMFLCSTAPFFVAVINSRVPKLLKIYSAAVIPVAGIAVILTISRAGVITIAATLVAATVATMSYRVTARKVAVALVVMLGATATTAKAWKTLSARFGESTLKKEYADKHVQGRGFYFRIAGAILDDQAFGVGPNNWSYWVSNKYGPKLGWKYVHYSGTDHQPSDAVPSGSNVDEAQAAPAHSLGALVAGEMGWGGLILFGLVWLRWFQMGASFLVRRSDDPMSRFGAGIFFCTCGIFAQSFTEWVYFQTPIYLTFHVLLGALASLYWARKRNRSEVPVPAAGSEAVWPEVRAQEAA